MRKYIQFILSRGLGTVVDTAVLWLLSHFIFSAGGYVATYILSPFISFEAAVMCNFLCSYFWIWSNRITHKCARSFWGHFLSFNISSFVGFLVKMLFLLLFEKLFGWGVVVCNLAALALSGAFNFLLSERVVFRQMAPRPDHELLSEEEIFRLSPLFRGRLGRLLARGCLRLFGVAQLNQRYDSIHHYRGPDAAHKALEVIGCRYLIGNAQRLDTLPEGAFITISNHPYGGLDGIILLDMIGHRRGDVKIMVNKILSRVEPLEENFICVTPTETQHHSADAATLAGLRTSLGHLHSGHPLSLFPAGAVSDLHLPRGAIIDRPWQEGILKFIQRAKLPIVPIHFEGRNSLFYYLLGVVDWRIRLLRLPRELLNKQRGRHRVNIGPTITPAEQQQAATLEEFGQLLRKSVYEMPKAEKYTPPAKPFR